MGSRIRKVLAGGGVVLLLGGGLAVWTVRTAERQTRETVKRYGLATSKEDIDRGLKIADSDNAALLLPELTAAVDQLGPPVFPNYKTPVLVRALSNPYPSNSFNPRVYEIATKISAKSGFFLNLDADQWMDFDPARLTTLSKAIQELLKSAIKAATGGDFERAISDLTISVKLASLWTKIPDSSGQTLAQRGGSHIRRAILAIASQPGRTPSQLATLRNLVSTIPLADLKLGARGDSLFAHSVIAGQTTFSSGAFNIDGWTPVSGGAWLADLRRPLWSPKVAEYYGKLVQALGTEDLDEAYQRTRWLETHLDPGIAGEIEGLLQSVWSYTILIKRCNLQENLMVSEALSAVAEKRLPRTIRDWTGSKDQTTRVTGSPVDWRMIARSRNAEFETREVSATDTKDPDDLYVVFQGGKLGILGR